jgi:hypothetical protein
MAQQLPAASQPPPDPSRTSSLFDWYRLASVSLATLTVAGLALALLTSFDRRYDPLTRWSLTLALFALAIHVLSSWLASRAVHRHGQPMGRSGRAGA